MPIFEGCNVAYCGAISGRNKPLAAESGIVPGLILIPSDNALEHIDLKIKKRVEYLLENGLIEELKTNLSLGNENTFPMRTSILYRNFLPYVTKEISLDAAVKNSVEDGLDSVYAQKKQFENLAASSNFSKEPHTIIVLEELLSKEDLCDLIFMSL